LNAERYALLWILVFGRHPISELGLTTRRWPPSLSLQAVLAVLLYIAAYRGDVVDLPPATQLMPLVALALAIGFFQALSFGIVPAIVLGPLLLMRPTISAT
jgi:hypothetical protein